MKESIVLIARDTELAPDLRVWGNGWWTPPRDREALDWLTLARFLGWSVIVQPPSAADFDVPVLAEARCVINACDPDSFDDDFTALLESSLSMEPLLIVSRAAASHGRFARLAGVARRTEQLSGRSLRWTGPDGERRWQCGRDVDAHALELSEGSTIWTTLDDSPILAVRHVKRGAVVTLGFHPSEARDQDGAITALLKNLLIRGSLKPTVWIDLANTLVLRMDDPGSAHSSMKHNWCYPKLTAPEWDSIGADLKRRSGRMSIGYVAGWVDDGDASRGRLTIAGSAEPRVPGAVHPSPFVRYEDVCGVAPGTVHDHESEYRGIQALRADGLAEVELHGYTHMHPDHETWARMPDRYETQSWFHELGPSASTALATLAAEEHPLQLGINAFQRHFRTFPSTLICPCEKWTDEVLEYALDLGLQLIGSYHMAIRHADRFCWTTHVFAPYLNEPASAWFDAELPVVACCHDREPALEGVGWLAEWLDRWQEAGAERIMDYRELAAAIGRCFYLEHRDSGLQLNIESGGSPALVRPLTVWIRTPNENLPPNLCVVDGLQRSFFPVEQMEPGLGRITLLAADGQD